MKSLLALGFLVQLVASTALAADGGVSCFEVEQRLTTAQRTLATCTETLRAQSTARDHCEAELAESNDRSSATQSKVDACVQAKDQLCQEAASFASGLLQGTVRGVGSCVSTDTERQLQVLLNAWFGVDRALGALDEYATGVHDVVPRIGGSTEAERHLARVLGVRTGTPLWNRRLLIEAFELTSPNAWSRIRAQGTAGIDAFFESRGPLPQNLVAEADAEHAESVGPAGPPLTAALRMTLSYLQLARCDERPDSRECGRARQLVDLLDDTGPLIVRRRVSEMWTTPCDALNPDTVRAWLQDFPTSRSKDKQKTLEELKSAARSKLYLCYLTDSDGEASYRNWASARLPKPAQLDARTLPLVDDFHKFVVEPGPLDRCGRAVRAMQRLEASSCSIDRSDVLVTLSAWAAAPMPADADNDLELCQRVATLLWSGVAVTMPLSPAEQVHPDEEGDTGVTKLRKACDERRGTGAAFEQSLVTLAHIAHDLGEPVNASPWRLDSSGTGPLERTRLQRAEAWTEWVAHVVQQESACDALGLSAQNCATCRDPEVTDRYDCEAVHRLELTWTRFRRLTLSGLIGTLATVLSLLWLLRVIKARRVFGESLRTVREGLEGLGITAAPDAWRLLFPERHDTLSLGLPRTPAWERWGTEACAVLVPGTTSVREADVNHAAAVALRQDVRVVFLLHAESASPDLGAVRATLDWAARGGTRAVQVLPLALSRLAWATRDEDLLDLIEATTLRGNPFEVRGPVRSSSQFWNRERLVAGLLTESRAGHWTVVTGLRRFGKSSLALEVARRTTGPSAYVDLAGFHHEVSYGETPAVAVDAILRTLVTRLADSASARFPAATVPPIPTEALDAPALAAWLRGLAVACGTSSGSPPPPMLLVLDEVEQLLSAPPEKLGRALDVLATLVGRLRSALSEPTSPHAGSTVGVVLCAAVHPLLWAPLATLGGQSLMGAFPSICVPALDDDAAHAMMRGLGSRQGIRFEDDALNALVRASHGVPLLLRRLGTSVLELYDADRARHGALGAVRIGIEGATEAIHREEREGSPLRVWVESEIAQADTSAGVLLRALAVEAKVSAVDLRRLVEKQVLERFAATGLTEHLAPAELTRRAQEAASVMVRLLADARLLEAHGDLTAPEAYSLPDGVLRRILSESRRK